MTVEKLIDFIDSMMKIYETHSQFAREKLFKRMKEMTAHQIETELMYIADMESRAYALKLLLEDIEEHKDEF